MKLHRILTMVCVFGCYIGTVLLAAAVGEMSEIIHGVSTSIAVEYAKFLITLGASLLWICIGYIVIADNEIIRRLNALPHDEK